MILSRFLLAILLSAGTICCAQDAPALPATTALDADTKPLPPIPDLLKAVEKHEDRDEALLRQYTYHVHSVTDEFDGSEAVKKTHITDSESFSVGGVRINRVVARDGKPLTPEEAKKESERVDKEVEKAQKRKAKRDAKEAEGKGNDSIISASRILELGTFSNERRIELNGRSTIVLDYAGNKDVKTKNAGEGIVKDLVGTVWIDESDRVIARSEGRFLEDFKLGLGLLLDIHKGLNFTFEQQKINGEVWLPKSITGRGKASVGVVVFRVHGQSRIEMSDYRKFRTDVTIVPGTQMVGEDGEVKPQDSDAPAPPSTPPPQ